ncbi:MAG: 3-oxoacid CoA-transferase subunit A [Oscillospiraceae bacterium]|nr:3-oxoacid CoA-transferase subunit A [Oscillospiraceae bacterium]
MKNKFISAQEAAAMVKDGDFLMVGGFLGHGTPDSIIQALVDSDVKDLIVACNDTGFPEGAEKHGHRGVSELVARRKIKKLYVSHIGTNPETGKQMSEGTLDVELVPQGTLAERIRCGGHGLGGVLTPTGVGTDVANGKQVLQINGKDYLLEEAMKGDVCLIRGSVVDTLGNVYYKGTTRNFCPLMAMACKTVIVEAEEIVEPGHIAAEHVMTPFVVVDYIVRGEKA